MNARDVVINEGNGPGGLVLDLRMGRDPGSERLSQLNAALQTLVVELEGEDKIDKRLVAALHGLSFHASGLIEGWMRQGKKWRTALVEDELAQVFETIDLIYEGGLE